MWGEIELQQVVTGTGSRPKDLGSGVVPVDLTDEKRGRPRQYYVSAESESPEDFTENELGLLLSTNIILNTSDVDLGFLVWHDIVISEFNNPPVVETEDDFMNFIDEKLSGICS